MLSMSIITSLLLYMSVFLLSSIAAHYYEKSYDSIIPLKEKKHTFGKLTIYNHTFKRLLIAVVVILPPVVISAFRANTIGTDTPTYLSLYQSNKYFDLWSYVKVYGTYMHDMEIGYQQLFHLSYLIGGGYNFVKGICSFS